MEKIIVDYLNENLLKNGKYLLPDCLKGCIIDIVLYNPEGLFFIFYFLFFIFYFLFFIFYFLFFFHFELPLMLQFRQGFLSKFDGKNYRNQPHG